MAEEQQGVNIREVQERVNANEKPSTPPALTQGDQDFMALVRQRNQLRYAQQSPEIQQPPQERSAVEEDVMNLARPSLLDTKYEVPTTPPVEIEEPTEGTEELVEVPEESEEEPTVDPVVEKRKTKETNMKALRTALKSSRDRVAELEAQMEAKDRELEKLAEIDELKNQIKEKDERLQKLKSYEDVVSLYGTEGFKEKFYDSVDNIRNQAVELAADYGVPAEVLDKAFQLTNQRQLNDYLSQWFDTFAVQDIRNYIKEAQQIISDRERAESEPAKARELLLSSIAKKKEAERVQSRENLKAAGTSAWADMVATYGNQESGVALLQEKNGNKTHNAVREGILQGASKEFGKMLAVLADNGLKELPQGAARALAARYQLGESAAYAMVQAENLKKEVAELKEELKKFTNYQRPLSNGRANNTSGGDASSTDLKGRELASHIYQKAVAKISQR